MAWPYSRLTNYVFGTTVPAGDMNSLQDAVNNIQSGGAPMIYQVNGAATTPLLKFGDSGGNARYLIDHNGFQTGGRVSQFREEWYYQPAATAPNFNDSFPASGNNFLTLWRVQTGANGSVAANGTTQNPNYAACTTTIISDTANGAQSLLRSSPTNSSGSLTFSFTDNLSMVLEFEVGLTSIATNHVAWIFGLSSGSDPTGVQAGFFFARRGGEPATDTTWMACLGDGVSSTNNATSTGVTVVTTASQLVPINAMRIEYHGRNTALGIAAFGGVGVNTAKALYFIDGVLTNTLSASAFTIPQALQLTFAAKCTAAATQAKAVIGPVVVTWNRGILAPPAL